MRADDPHHLVADESQHIAGKDAPQIGEMFAGSVNVCEQPIKRNEGRNCGEKSEQDIECRARSHSRDVIGNEFARGTAEYASPPLGPKCEHRGTVSCFDATHRGSRARTTSK